MNGDTIVDVESLLNETLISFNDPYNTKLFIDTCVRMCVSNQVIANSFFCPRFLLLSKKKQSRLIGGRSPWVLSLVYKKSGFFFV